MSLNFLNKLLHREPDFHEKLAALEEGRYICTHCYKDIDYQLLTPLSMSHCPYCNDLFIVPQKLDDWWVLAPLGAGGMGAVYMARHAGNPSVQAAVKVLQADEQNKAFLELLINEAKVAYSFGKHHNLSQVYGYGYKSDSAYMIMAIVNGDRLDNVIARGSIDCELCLYYMHDLILALKHIYDTGYLYRDLKPENIIINGKNEAILIDYGLCMTLDEAWHYAEDDIMGSPLYMPPERVQGCGEDARADLYSLGMVIYHALKGKPYFSQTEVMKIVQSHLKTLRVQTKHKLSGIDENVQNLIDRLIRLDRDERLNDYDVVLEHVDALLQHYNSVPTKNKVVMERRKMMFG